MDDIRCYEMLLILCGSGHTVFQSVLTVDGRHHQGWKICQELKGRRVEGRGEQVAVVFQAVHQISRDGLCQRQYLWRQAYYSLAVMAKQMDCEHMPKFGKTSTVQMFKVYGRSLIDVHIVGVRRYR